jgi:acyl carrier protein
MSDRLKDLFATVLSVSAESLSDNSSPENIPSWDSMNAMRLVAAMEAAFNVKLTTIEVMKMRSLAGVRNVLRRKGVDI